MNRDKNGRFAKGFKQGINEENPNWKGDNVSKLGIHAWLVRKYGKPLKCEVCKSVIAKRYDWAKKSGYKYKRDKSHFIRLCRSCHVKLDFNYKKKKIVEYRKTVPTIKNICQKCEMKFVSKDNGRQYCSKKCWYERNKCGKN